MNTPVSGESPAPSDPFAEPGSSESTAPAVSATSTEQTGTSGPLDRGGEPTFVGEQDDPDDAAPLPWMPPIEPFDPVDRPRNRLLVGAGLAIVIAALGFPLGWLWSSLAPWLPARVSGNELFYADPEGEQRAAQEGWFIVLSLGLGIMLAVIVWFALRRFRGSAMVAALAIGSIAAGWIAWWYGHNIGRTAAFAQARSAKDGALVKLPPDLRIKPAGNLGHWHGVPYLGGDLLYIAVGSVAMYLILVGFSSSPFLHRRPEAKVQPMQPVEG